LSWPPPALFFDGSQRSAVSCTNSVRARLETRDGGTACLPIVTIGSTTRGRVCGGYQKEIEPIEKTVIALPEIFEKFQERQLKKKNQFATLRHRRIADPAHP
jgi:hypothetical protein